MKKLLLLLFSMLLFSSATVFADDILDFEIEGISIGDSLLDYMTEGEILEEIERTKNRHIYMDEPYKYASVYLRKDFPTYSWISFYVKNNATNQYVTNSNEKYTILSIRGFLPYIEDFNNCIAKRDEITEILSIMFPNSTKVENLSSHSLDPSGNSITDAISLNLDSGDQAQIICSNWEETFRIKNNYSEGLSVLLATKELTEWR